MKKIFLILYALLSAMLFTFLIYNFNTIFARQFSQIVLESLSADRPLIYAITAVFYFINYLLAVRWFKQSKVFTAFALMAAPVSIDASVLFFGPQLMPLRFPFATIFPVAGIVLAWLSYHRRKIFFPAVALTATALVLLLVYALPGIVWKMQNDNDNLSFSAPLHSASFKTASGNTVSYDSLRTGKVLLLDFYFVGCPPCEYKIPALIELQKKMASDDFRILLICDGNISTFNQFVAHAKRYADDSSLVFLYDHLGIKSSVSNSVDYPLEVIINKNNGVVDGSTGFNAITREKYIRENIKTIKSVL